MKRQGDEQSSRGAPIERLTVGMLRQRCKQERRRSAVITKIHSAGYPQCDQSGCNLPRNLTTALKAAHAVPTPSRAGARRAATPANAN